AQHVPEMKEFVGHDGRRVLSRANADGRRVGMLHPAPAAGTEMEQENIARKWRIAHERRFREDDPAGDVLEVLAGPDRGRPAGNISGMDHDADGTPGEFEREI